MQFVNANYSNKKKNTHVHNMYIHANIGMCHCFKN